MDLILFLNSETTGLPIKKLKTPTSKNLDNWPRIIALQWKIGYLNKENKIILLDNENVYCIIKPVFFAIPPETILIHGISQDIAKNGLDIDIVLSEFKKRLEQKYEIGENQNCVIKTIVSHNTPFHINNLKAEFIRTNIQINLNKYEIIDIMNYNHLFKYPTLDKLFEYCYKRIYNRSHPRKSNIMIMVKCYEHLYNTTNNQKPIDIKKDDLVTNKDDLIIKIDEEQFIYPTIKK